MKINNKGITLAEALCYIVVFSLLLTVITGYLLFLYNFNLQNNTSEFTEVMFLEKIATNIKDYKMINKEDIYIEKYDSNNLIIKGVNTNQTYLSYDFKKKKMYNGLISKDIVFETLKLEFFLKDNVLLIINEDNNYRFIVEVWYENYLCRITI